MLVKVYYGAGVDGTEVVGSTTAGKIYCNSKCKTDFGDIRFTDSLGSLIDCWREEKTDSNYALYWVEVSDDLDAGNATIYIYYGNAVATYPYLASDLLQGQGTFHFFDDFGNGVVDAWWNVIAGAPVEAGGTITVNADNVQSLNLMTLDGHRFKALSRYVGGFTNSGQLGVNNTDGAERILFWLYGALPNQSRMNTRDGGAQCSLDYASSNAWREYEHTWYKTGGVGQWVEYWIDNVFQVHHSAGGCCPDNDMYVRLLSVTNNPTLEVDWLFVGKFTSPEPTHGAWGAVETAVPADPTNLTAACVGTTRIDLLWTDNATDETAYYVERDDGGWHVISGALPPNTNSYIDNTITCDVTYLYRVRAYNACGYSGYVTLGSGITCTCPTYPTVEGVRGKPSVKWKYEYDWKHVPSEKITAIIKLFNFEETMKVLSIISKRFVSGTRRITCKLGRVFSESVAVSCDLNAMFSETSQLSADVEHQFEETRNVSSMLSWFWLEYVKVLAITRSIEETIINELDTMNELDEEEKWLDENNDDGDDL